jgi:hypothetical protein
VPHGPAATTERQFVNGVQELTRTCSVSKVAKAWVLPWKKEKSVCGVADGWHGADRIGTKAQAEAIVRDIAKHKDA